MKTYQPARFDGSFKPQNWIALSAIALLAAALLGATVQADNPARSWSWSADAATVETIHIDIIRGGVEVLDTSKPKIMVTATVEGSKQVWSANLTLEHDGPNLKIKDHYAVKLPLWLHKECLPPTDGRGDFWHTDARFKVVISAPSDVDIQTKIADPTDVSP